MPKNIVVFSDGTGQEGGADDPNTNVYKLFCMIEDRTENQVSFYDRGLGTGWRKLTGNAAGVGITENILECYQFIFDHFEADDQIYLFGFSRGATTVRSLSSFIHFFGILPKSRPELIKEAYKIYKKRPPKNASKKKAEEWEKRRKNFILQNRTMWTRIKFLGVWDTVAALGVPFKGLDALVDRIPIFKHEYHDLHLSENVDYARHALAIDDERKTFKPELWEKKIRFGQDMKQVWFCGMHTDVGGGYKEQELSDIALQWMVQEAKEHGLLIYSKHDVKPNPDPYGKMHDSRGGRISWLYRQKVREWDYESRDKPVVHKSVKIRKENRANKLEAEYRPWILERDHAVEPWPEGENQ
jgi:uncharacterized protein (DUF2235 family)